MCSVIGKFVFAVLSETVTVLANVAVAAFPLVPASISSVCVVTNVCIWSAVATPVPLFAIAAVLNTALVPNPKVVLALDAAASSTSDAPKVEIVVLAGNDSVLISASTSLSINAPALVTLVVSVTSAPASTETPPIVNASVSTVPSK